MLMTAIVQETGIFIPTIDAQFWQKKADKNGQLTLEVEFIEKDNIEQAALKEKKRALAGLLSQYANPDLIPLEEKAVEMAIMEKYGVN